MSHNYGRHEVMPIGISSGIDLCKSGKQPTSTISTLPLSLFSEYERPDKSIAVQRDKSRFNVDSCYNEKH